MYGRPSYAAEFNCISYFKSKRKKKRRKKGLPLRTDNSTILPAKKRGLLTLLAC